MTLRAFGCRFVAFRFHWIWLCLRQCIQRVVCWSIEMKENVLKTIAVLCAVSVALLTGSLYIRGVRDDIHDQEQLNQRLNELCDKARSTNWSDRDRSEFLKRNCERQQSWITSYSIHCSFESYSQPFILPYYWTKNDFCITWHKIKMHWWTINRHLLYTFRINKSGHSWWLHSNHCAPEWNCIRF